jgi:hypothetical protein
MTRPMSRRRRTIPTFTEKRWLVSGRPYAIPFLEGGAWAQRLWREFGAMITERHIGKHPGTRPANWWRYDAPTRRDSSTETQLAYLRRLDLLTAEERQRVAHVRPRLRRSAEPSPAGHPLSDRQTTTASRYHPLSDHQTGAAPAGWQFVLIDDRVELVRAGSR